ncbi:thioredoxin-domain-containing protein [Meredithblackwellia eburnea MCA 4105]
MQLTALVSTLLVLTPLVSAGGANYDSKWVKALSSSTFKKHVTGSQKLTLAAFHAPWCGHCVKLGPEYEKAAKNLEGLVNLVAVDCDDDKNKPLCGQYDIKGFPTLKIFPGGSAPPSDYQGPRTAKGIVEYVTGQMPTFVKRATTAAEVKGLKAKSSKKPITLLFTSSATVTPLYKALSTDFFKTVDFYAAREAKVGGVETMREFGVDKTPAIVVLRGEGEEVVKYEGPLKYEAIKTFLAPFAKSGAGAGKGAKASPQAHGKEEL